LTKTNAVLCVEIVYVGKGVWLNAIDLHCHKEPRSSCEQAGTKRVPGLLSREATAAVEFAFNTLTEEPTLEDVVREALRLC